MEEFPLDKFPLPAEPLVTQLPASHRFYTNQQALIRSVYFSFLIWLSVMMCLAIVGKILLGLPGFYAALMGGAIGGSFFVITGITIVRTYHMEGNTMMAIIMGSWLLKVVCLLIILKLLHHAMFFNHSFFAITIIIALISVLGTQIWTIFHTKTLTIE